MRFRDLHFSLILAFVLLAFGLSSAEASGLGADARAPELRGGPWLNSKPLRLADLRGNELAEGAEVPHHRIGELLAGLLVRLPRVEHDQRSHFTSRRVVARMR